MKFVTNEELRRIINEAVNVTINEAGVPKPVGGGMPRPVGGGVPRPVGGGVPRPVGGGAPRPVGGGVPKPAGGAPAPVSAPSPAPANAGAPAPASAPAAPAANAQNDEKGGGVDAKGNHYPGILNAKYEPFYETKDPNEADKEVLKIWLTYINNVVVNPFVTFLNKDYSDAVFVTMPLYDPTCRIPKNFKKNNGTGYESGFDKYWVKLIIRPGKNQDFIKDVPGIVDGLYQLLDKYFSGKPKRGRPFGGSFQGNAGKISYDSSYKTKFEQYLIDTVKNTPTPEEVEQVNLKIAQTTRELLANLKDPAVQQKLGMIRVILNAPSNAQVVRAFNQNKDLAADDGKLAGWLLSKRNALKVLAQDPNATYLAQEHTWRQWGHEVIDPSKYIIVNTPTTWKNHDEKAFDKACRDAGFPGGADDYRYAKKNKTVEMTKQRYFALMHLSNLYNPNGTEFGWKKFYDVSNTRIIPGLASEFLPGPDQKIGLSNNIAGIPNDAARAAGVNIPAQPQAAAAPAAANATNPEEVELFRDCLSAVVASVTGSGPSGLGVSAERDIVKWAYHYADYIRKTQYASMIPTTAENFKMGFAAAVAVSIGIVDSEAADYLKQALNASGKDTRIDQLIAKWHGEYVDLLVDVQKEMNAKMRKSGKKSYKKVVEEDGVGGAAGLKILNFNEFKNIMKGQGGQYDVQNDNVNAQQLQESFFSFLDKMEGEYE